MAEILNVKRDYRDVTTCNERTSQIIAPTIYGEVIGTILKRKSKTIYLCHFPRIGIKEINPNKLIAFKKEETYREVSPHIVEVKHGNGAAGNRLENHLKAKSRRERQRKVASTETSNYAGGKIQSDSALKTIKSLEGGGRKKLTEWERDFKYRGKSVSEKKGAKMRISASEAQSEYQDLF